MIWMPTQNVKNATILLIIIVPVPPTFFVIFCPCDRMTYRIRHIRKMKNAMTA